MNKATVSIHMLGASKYAQSNRFDTHARSIEVCTEQPFRYACSEHRSMHRATVLIRMLGASKYAQSNRFDMHARSIEVCTEQPF